MARSDRKVETPDATGENEDPRSKLITLSESSAGHVSSDDAGSNSPGLDLSSAPAGASLWLAPGAERHAPAAPLTFSLAAAPSVPKTRGGRWVSPVLQLPPALPHMWIPKQQESRFRVSRKRFEAVLDKLVGNPTRETAVPKTLVLVAHPDDEAIGVGARLKGLPDALIVYVTDGAPRDPACLARKGFTSREDYAASRRQELEAALRVVGVGPERTRCLNIVDGEATQRLVELAYTVADLFDEVRPEIVLTHPYEGGHTDHDATAFAVHLACGMLRREGVPAPLVLEFTSYNNNEGRKRVAEFIPFFGVRTRESILPASLQALKREMFDCFVSQKECLSAFPVDRESFRPAPRYVFTDAPHEGTLLYEKSNALTGEHWRDQARRALERLRAKKRETRTMAAG